MDTRGGSAATTLETAESYETRDAASRSSLFVPLPCMSGGYCTRFWYLRSSLETSARFSDTDDARIRHEDCVVARDVGYCRIGPESADLRPDSRPGWLERCRRRDQCAKRRNRRPARDTDQRRRLLRRRLPQSRDVPHLYPCDGLPDHCARGSDIANRRQRPP